MKRTPEPNKRNPLPLEDALQMAELNGPGLVETSIPEAWSQGRACFGGLLLAQVARGGEALVSTDRKLRSLNITFVAPTGPGTVRIRYEVIREGRSVSHIQARMTQEDRVVVMSTLAYGTSRPLSLSMESAPMPDAGKPGDGYEMPFNPPATPEFTQHIDYRWVVDHMPFSGSDVAHVRGWVRPTIPSPVDPPLILAMMDAYPPPLWSMATGLFMASSLSSHYQVLDLPDSESNPHPWFLYDGPATVVGGGYSDVVGRLWHEDGTLVAVGMQHFADFSERLATS